LAVNLSNAKACVFIFGGCAPCSTMQAGSGEVVAARGIGGAAKKSGKGHDMPDVVVLCSVAKAPDRHVHDQAAAKIADRLVLQSLKLCATIGLPFGLYVL
jgi:hypothetical protein